MLRTDALAELREVLGDVTGPVYGWSDLRLMRFLSLGQDQFCKDTGFFTDFANYTITTVAGTSVYAIDPRLIEIKEIWYGEFRLSKFFQHQRQSPYDSTTEFPETGTSGSQGVPYAWQVDERTGYITLYPTPDAAYTLSLRVWRRSRTPLDRKTSTITLGGTKHTGDIITATVNGVAYSYTTLVGDGTLSAVATALAAVIDASAGFVSTASGQVISVASSDLSVSTTTTAVVSGAGATTTATGADNYSAEFEIPEDHHFAPIEWAAWKAYSDHDRERIDKVKAAEHLAVYKDLVREGKRAFRRLCGGAPEFAPNPLYLV